MRIQDIIEWAKNQSELSEEVKQKEIEIEEIVKQALEDYWQYKNSGSKRNKFLFDTEKEIFKYGDDIKDTEICGV